MLNNLNTTSGRPGKASKESSKYDALDTRLQDVENKLDDLQNDVYTESTHTDNLEVTQTADINSIVADQVNSKDITANTAIIDSASIKEAEITTLTNKTTIEEADITQATIPNIKGNVAVDGTLTTKSITTESFAIDRLATENLKVEEKAEIKSIESTDISAEDISTINITSDDINTNTITSEDITTDTLQAEETTTTKLTSKTIDAEKISAEVLESAESTLKALTNDSIKFTGELDLEQELVTEEDWYTITIPPFENAIIQLNADYRALDTSTTKHWGISIVATKEQAIIEWSEGDFNGIKDFSFNEETKETRLRVRAIDKINYHIIHNDLELEGDDILDIKYGEVEDVFDVFYAPEAWRGYYLQTYAMNSDIDSYSVFRYNGVTNLPGLRVEQKMFDDIYIKYNIWLPDYFDNDETPHFVKGQENQYLSVTEMDVRDEDGNLETKPITSWHTPVDNDSYPTPLSNSSCLISERSVINYNGTAEFDTVIINYDQEFQGTIADFKAGMSEDVDYYIYKDDEYCKIDAVLYDSVADDYQVGYNTEEYGVLVLHLEPTDEITVFIQNATSESETAYPISELRDNTTVHGSATVEENLTVEDSATVAKSFESPHIFDNRETYKEGLVWKAENSRAEGENPVEEFTLAHNTNIKIKARKVKLSVLDIIGDIENGNEYWVKSNDNPSYTLREINKTNVWGFPDVTPGYLWTIDAIGWHTDSNIGNSWSVSHSNNGQNRWYVSTPVHPNGSEPDFTSAEIEVYVEVEDEDDEDEEGQWQRYKNNRLDRLAAFDNKAEFVDKALVVYDKETDTIKTCNTDLRLDNLYVANNLYVDGTIHAVNEETIEATSDTITLRQNNPTGLGNNEVSGLVVNNYSGDGKLLEVATDNTGTLRVGTGTGTTTTYDILYIDKNGKYYNGNKDEITKPTGVLTSYSKKEEVDDDDLGFLTKYTSAVFTTITLNTMQPVSTRAEESAMVEDAIVCWNRDNTRLEATNTLHNPTTFTCCVTTPWMCGTSSGVCAWENTEDEDVECLIPIPGWNADCLLLERTNCLMMNPTNGDIFANHIYGIFDGSVDTAACIDIYDWHAAIASGGLPSYVYDDNGCRIEAYDTNGCFTGYAVTLAKPERLFVPAVVECTCGHSVRVYGSDWVSYNLCNNVVEYKNPVEFGDWSTANSNKTCIHGSCMDFKFQDYQCGDYTAAFRQTYGGRVDFTVNNGYGTTQANASNTFCFCSTGDLYVPQWLQARYLCTTCNYMRVPTHLCVENEDWESLMYVDTNKIALGQQNSTALNNRTLVAGYCNGAVTGATYQFNGTSVQTFGIEIGAYNYATNAIVIGTCNSTMPNYCGNTHEVNSTAATLIGNFNYDSGWADLAVGAYNDIYKHEGCWEGCTCQTGYYGIAIGFENKVASDYNVAVGIGNIVGRDYDQLTPEEGGWNNTVVGMLSSAFCRGNVVIGQEATAAVDYGVAIGTHAYSNTDGGSTVINSSGRQAKTYRPSGRALATWNILSTGRTIEVTFGHQRVDGNWTRYSLARDLYYGLWNAGVGMYTDSQWHIYGATGAFGCSENSGRVGVQPITGLGLCSNGTDISARFYYNNNTTEDILSTNTCAFGNSSLLLKVLAEYQS